MIEFEFIDTVIPGFDSEFFICNISNLLLEESKSQGDITFIFCNDDYLLEVNKQYLNHDYYTDIITFDYCVGNLVSGDLFISIDRVEENAKDFGVRADQELWRVVYHGILHLCGYKDKSDEDILVMRMKEQYYLDRTVSRETLN
jgi:probable rRNA maturation factor